MARTLIAINKTSGKTRSVHLEDGIRLRRSPLDAREAERYGKEADVSSVAKLLGVSRREADEWVEALRGRGWGRLVVYDAAYWEGTPSAKEDAAGQDDPDGARSAMVPADGPGLSRPELGALWGTRERQTRVLADRLVGAGLLRYEERPRAGGGSPAKVYWRTDE